MLPSAFRIAKTEVTAVLDNSTKGYLTATPTKTTNTNSLIFNDSVYVETTEDCKLVTKNLLLEGTQILFRKQHPTSETDATLKTTTLPVLRCISDNNHKDKYGFGTYLGAKGITVVGSGESVQSVCDNLENLGVRNELEYLYLTSDASIIFLTNCQTWNSRKSMTFDASGLTVTGAITATGAITGSLTYNAVWNDYAEYFPRGENTEPGDIIALNNNDDIKELYVRATKNSLRVVGVHSDTFGHIIGGEAPTDPKTNFKKYNEEKYIPVGLIGRVNVKVIGKVTKGAFIVPSNTPGVGKTYDPKYDKKDHIIGYLVEYDNLDNVVRRLKMKII